MLRYDGLSSEYGVDLFLSQFARFYGAPVVSLENPELSAQAFREDDASDRIALATATIEALESGHARELGLRILEVWAESRYDDFHDTRSGANVLIQMWIAATGAAWLKIVIELWQSASTPCTKWAIVSLPPSDTPTW